MILPVLVLAAIALAQDCFNCARGDQCSHFADCNEYTGLCGCPPGFGGADCAQPVCGSLAQGANRKLRGDNQTCECENQFYGINCNMCSEDSSCKPLMPDGQADAARCLKTGELVAQNFHMCDVTNHKLVETLKGKRAQATFDCERNSSTCDFQLWVDQVESFYCKFDNCEFNGLNYNCQNVKCECRPGEFLCGKDGSVDISAWLKNSVRGPGNLDCDPEGNCSFDEPAMNKLIQFIFGDKSIELNCQSSECLHYSQLPDYEPNLSGNTSIIEISVSILLVLGTLGGLFYLLRRMSSGGGASLGANASLSTENPVFSTTPVGVYFNDISYEINGKQILNGVSGFVNPGNVLAIMGGSGAGKTTLLDILAAKAKTGTISGSLNLNGTPLDANSKEPKRLIGYVDQSDTCLVGTQTVYECVLFSALLRLPASLSRDTKELRVCETLKELGISHLSNTQIRHGLSGGEKRRVSIACELVTSPSVLFLDEPTSGLDAFNAFSVVETLLRLAKNSNRTIIFTIHQPRSNIVQLFDNIMLLAKGSVIFTGKCEDGQNYFADIGYECPPNYNFADFIVDLSMKPSIRDAFDTEPQPTTQSDLGNETESCIEEVHTQPFTVDPVDQWQDFSFHRDQITMQTAQDMATSQIILPKSTTDGVEHLQGLFNESRYSVVVRDQIANGTKRPVDLISLQFKRPSFANQVKLISIRTCNSLLRDPLLIFTHYGISIGTGLLCGVLYYKVDNSISGFQNRLGLFFFILALQGFSSLTEIAVNSYNRPVFISERSNGYYKPAAYFTATLFWDIFPLRLGPPLLLGLIIYPLVGLNTQDRYAPPIFFLVLLLFNANAALQTVFISYLIEDSGVASLVSSMTILFGVLFAGLFLNQDSIPLPFSWIKYMSMYHYAYEALTVNEVKSLTLIEDKFGLQIEVPGSAILSAFGFSNLAVSRDTWGLLALASVLLISSFICMHKYLYELR